MGIAVDCDGMRCSRARLDEMFWNAMIWNGTGMVERGGMRGDEIMMERIGTSERFWNRNDGTWWQKR